MFIDENRFIPKKTLGDNYKKLFLYQLSPYSVWDVLNGSFQFEQNSYKEFLKVRFSYLFLTFDRCYIQIITLIKNNIHHKGIDHLLNKNDRYGLLSLQCGAYVKHGFYADTICTTCDVCILTTTVNKVVDLNTKM